MLLIDGSQVAADESGSALNAPVDCITRRVLRAICHTRDFSFPILALFPDSTETLRMGVLSTLLKGNGCDSRARGREEDIAAQGVVSTGNHRQDYLGGSRPDPQRKVDVKQGLRATLLRAMNGVPCIGVGSL